MENDSIRSNGSSTLVDIWIEGKLRAISVSRSAIEDFLALTPDRAAAMSEGDRCEFVRKNLALVVRAAKTRLKDTEPGAEAIAIDAGHLPGAGRGRGVDRRKPGNRRKSERRKPETPGERPVGDRRQGERRRGDRRKGDRRGPKA